MNTNKDKAKQETGILYSKTCVKKILMSNGSLMNVACLKNQFVVYLREAVLHRFYLRNQFDFLKVHGIMNTSGLLQSK